MPAVRFARDKRGYEYVYLVHSSTRRGRPARSRVLYWYRTPPGVKIGREPFDRDVREALERQYPGISFDWDRITSAQMPPPDMTEHWRERRRAERAAKAERRAAEQAEAAEAESPEAEGFLDAEGMETPGVRHAAEVEVERLSSDHPADVHVSEASELLSAEASAGNPESPTDVDKGGQAPQRRRRRRGGRRRRGRSGEAGAGGAASEPSADGGAATGESGHEPVDREPSTDPGEE